MTQQAKIEIGNVATRGHQRPPEGEPKVKRDVNTFRVMELVVPENICYLPSIRDASLFEQFMNVAYRLGDKTLHESTGEVPPSCLIGMQRNTTTALAIPGTF